MVAETAEAQFRNYTVAACLWNFYMIFTGVLFFCLRKKDFIRKRNVPACMTQVFFSVAVGNQWLARSTLWPAVVHSIPWIVSVALNYMCDINWMFSYFFRTVVLLNEYYANKSASTNFKKSALKKEEAVYQHLSLNKAEKFIFRVQKRLFNRKDNKFRRFASTTLLGESSGSTILIKRGIGLPQLLKCLAVSTTIEVILFLIVLGYNKAFSIHTLMDPEFTGNGKEWVPLYICVGIFLITLPYFLHLTRNVHDSIYLKLEHTFALASFYPLFLLYILTYFVKSVSELFPFGYTFWLFLLATITHTVTITCPALYTILKGGDERILLENSIDSFHRVLNDPSLFLILKDVLVEDFSIENALFIEECMLLDGTPSAMGSRHHSTFLEEDGTPQRIKFIIDTFIVSGAPYELNISSTARKSILSKLQNPEEPLSATVLERMKSISITIPILVCCAVSQTKDQLLLLKPDLV
ncbi:hypothetical protein BKA69DRAFT_1066451 [Paraphysoderma sedebokerense]|nr:hypothetical protein BKA69DRAFT_1066451 [Paraphysoderma sedebokerense]